MRTLVVTSPFGGHEVGHRITDAAEIQAILAGEHAPHVVRSDHEAEQAKPAKKGA